MTWEEAAELCDEILEKLHELPDRAEEFKESVEGKVESMKEWILEHEKVTDKQADSLENMMAGAERWLR